MQVFVKGAELEKQFVFVNFFQALFIGILFKIYDRIQKPFCPLYKLVEYVQYDVQQVLIIRNWKDALQLLRFDQ